MESPLIHHFLIGLPGSGKSTFAKEVLARIYDDSIIISSDRAREELYGEATIQGNWQEIESFIFQQVQSAIAQGKTIIYDATNAKRAHRLEWLQKVETLLDDPPLWMAWQINTPAKQAKQWNKQRDREVPEGVIDRMETNLNRFPPKPSEGFIKVETIDVTKQETAKLKVQEVMQNLARSRSQRQNRASNYQLHRYSLLLDFERLMFLISLILQYPGLGKLRETAPDILQNLLGKKAATLEDDLDEIKAVMARLRGNVYADRSAIAAVEKANELSVPAIIKSESQLVVKGANEWMERWKEENWKQRGNKPLENKELWQKLDQGLTESKFPISFDFFKTHSNHPANDRADALARQYQEQKPISEKASQEDSIQVVNRKQEKEDIYTKPVREPSV